MLCGLVICSPVKVTSRLDSPSLVSFSNICPRFLLIQSRFRFRGKFTQAKVRLAQTVTREQVLQLNEAPFYEGGRQRTVTVDDARGSPGQKCVRSTARYCRGQNLRFVNPCNCDHPASPTEGALWDLTSIDLSSAKADEIMLKFRSTMPGAKVLAIKAIRNETLLGLHEHYRSYLRSKNGCEPTCLELYHGTNNAILDRIYTHGIHPPSDRKPSEECPVSAGRVCAPASVIQLASSASSATLGAIATCLASACTLLTKLRSPTGTSPDPKVASIGWLCVLC